MLKVGESSFKSGICYADLGIAHPYQVFYEYPLLDVERLSDLCRKIYFPTDDYTIATFITVHVAMYFLCNQMPKDTAKDLNFSSDELQQLADTCAHNAETAMRSMRLFMEASFETIEALLLAVRHFLPIYRAQISCNVPKCCGPAQLTVSLLSGNDDGGAFQLVFRLDAYDNGI